MFPARRKTDLPVTETGFGSSVGQRGTDRLLNKDGSYNVRVHGVGWFQSLRLYQLSLTVSWPLFFFGILSVFVLLNLVFAFLYLACGPGALVGGDETTGLNMFFRAFFFSVQTLATIGYGAVSPRGMAPNVIVSLEAVVGLVGVAVIAGASFARFSRPRSSLRFSSVALMQPYNGGTAFSLRVANTTRTQLIDLEASITFSRLEGGDVQRLRRFYRLPLERDTVLALPLSWTIVHPIDEASPLLNETVDSLKESEAEFIVALSAIDEVLSQTVYARTSYRTDEIRWGKSFRRIFREVPGDGIEIDLSLLNTTEPQDVDRKP